jgi:hypothetical protein
MNKDALKTAREAWERDTLEPTLKRFPERRQRFVTSSDIELAPIHAGRPANHVPRTPVDHAPICGLRLG